MDLPKAPLLLAEGVLSLEPLLLGFCDCYHPVWGTEMWGEGLCLAKGLPRPRETLDRNQPGPLCAGKGQYTASCARLLLGIEHVPWQRSVGARGADGRLARSCHLLLGAGGQFRAQSHSEAEEWLASRLQVEAREAQWGQAGQEQGHLALGSAAPYRVPAGAEWWIRTAILKIWVASSC